MSEEALAKALAALQQNDQPKALQLLRQLLHDDPACAQAWLWMSKVVDDPARQQECLEQVLLLDPGNQEAREGLALLQLGQHAGELARPAETPASDHRKLGDYLVQQGVIDQPQLDQALEQQRVHFEQSGERLLLGDILLKQGWLRAKALATAVVLQQEELLSPQPSPQRLGEYLVVRGLLTPAQLRIVLIEQARMRQAGKQIMLGQLLIFGGYITPLQLQQALEQQRLDFLQRFT